METCSGCGQQSNETEHWFCHKQDGKRYVACSEECVRLAEEKHGLNQLPIFKPKFTIIERDV